jgi:hypothetical protein
MADFSAEWLALREPADAAARSSSVTGAIIEVVEGRSSLAVLDLATGTGSNARYLADRLPCDQDWLLVDHDRNLLAQVPQRMRSWAASRQYRFESQSGGFDVRGGRGTYRFVTRSLDLDTIRPDLVDGRDLVTASALLDLVSDRWLQLFAAACRRSGAAVLFTLTYDGRTQCSPEHDDDERIRDLVNRHQRTDKGLGEALGPLAADRLYELLVGLNHHVVRAPSDWVLGAESEELQRQLVDGWASAAASIARDQSRLIARWRAERLDHIRHGRSRISVGHQDLAAWPLE